MNTLIPRQINTIRTDIPIAGTSGAFVVEAENGELLLCKPHNPKNDKWLAPNELLCGLLGQLVNGPFLQPYLVELDEELLDISGIRKKPSFAMAALTSGIGFSIDFFSELVAQGTLPESDIALLTNGDKAITILLFDAWVHNIDRYNSGNLIFVPNRTSPKRKQKAITMYAIDHGYAFGGLDWDRFELVKENFTPQIENRLPIIENIANYYFSKNGKGEQNRKLKNREALDKNLRVFETIDRKDLRDTLGQIPNSWEVTDEEKSSIEDYLYKRKDLLRPLFENFLVL